MAENSDGWDLEEKEQITLLWHPRINYTTTPRYRKCISRNDVVKIRREKTRKKGGEKSRGTTGGGEKHAIHPYVPGLPNGEGLYWKKRTKKRKRLEVKPLA